MYLITLLHILFLSDVYCSEYIKLSNILNIRCLVMKIPKGKVLEKSEFSLSLPICRREVKCVKKDEDGDILAIGGDWGLMTREEAIKEIKSGVCEYFVKNGATEVLIHVISDRYLRTSPDSTIKNNLDFLPECYGGF
ncbi:MAG: DUF3892 domain-containing protein [Chlamydiales bacterium]